MGYEHSTEEEFTARTVSDPEVQVDLIQGDALLGLLMTWRKAYEDADSQAQTSWISEILRSYTNGLAVDEASDPQSHTLGPSTPLRVGVVLPHEDGSRGAFAVRVRSLEDERVGISTPMFFNGVEGNVVVSEIPPEMLPSPRAALLRDLGASVLDQQLLPEDLWRLIVATVTTLGTETVEDAIKLFRDLGMNTGAGPVFA